MAPSICTTTLSNSHWLNQMHFTYMPPISYIKNFTNFQFEPIRLLNKILLTFQIPSQSQCINLRFQDDPKFKPTCLQIKHEGYIKQT